MQNDYCNKPKTTDGCNSTITEDYSGNCKPKAYISCNLRKMRKDQSTNKKGFNEAAYRVWFNNSSEAEELRQVPELQEYLNK